MGCAISNRTLLAIFNRRLRFEIKAKPSCAALIPINLVIGLDWLWNKTRDYELAILDPVLRFRCPLLLLEEGTPSNEQLMRIY